MLRELASRPYIKENEAAAIRLRLHNDACQLRLGHVPQQSQHRPRIIRNRPESIQDQLGLVLEQRPEPAPGRLPDHRVGPPGHAAGFEKRRKGAEFGFRVVDARGEIVETAAVQSTIVERKIAEATILKTRIVKTRIVETRIVETRIVDATIAGRMTVERMTVERKQGGLRQSGESGAGFSGIEWPR